MVLLAGASRGVGLAFAEGLARVGADVACLDIIPPSDDFKAIASKFKVRTKHVICSVADESELAKAITDVTIELGRLDICVACAGIYRRVPFLETTTEILQTLYGTNVFGAFNTAKHAAKAMVKQQEERMAASGDTNTTDGLKDDFSIILVASVASQKTVLPMEAAAYCSSKGAVRSMVPTMALELAPYGIRVNSISPGYVETEITRPLADLKQGWSARTILKRIAQPDDIQGPCVFLASEAARYVTGEDVVVDGGLLRM
ncbi:hypothetical protein LTR47_009906 [Exophiala xenobiotica]|nr:hypothetical protein LTR47_009906 [Exophiala xenobiotica]KAK5243931.1 hypothetical protein LTS06_010407 [Exophiala xenobiotica]KAK5282185.1 hypothetical protein LTR40_003667 [Exophiala xenobiotica]KAK5347938.1 hypothetical protein LTR61_008190 [Exophiala xenobiotica]KAK5361453.1 hypothetical protein LTS03_010406 [Exophiala xenobiotica]